MSAMVVRLVFGVERDVTNNRLNFCFHAIFGGKCVGSGKCRPVAECRVVEKLRNLGGSGSVGSFPCALF